MWQEEVMMTGQNNQVQVKSEPQGGYVESDCEITAIRYNGTRKWFTAWGAHGKPFQVRRSALNVDQDKIEEAKQQPGKRCKLTGARCDVDVGSSKTDLALFTGLGLEVRHDLPSAKYQVSKEFCAVNSVANLIDLPKVLYDHITKQGKMLELEKVRNIINGWKSTPCQLHRIKGVENTHLLAWLLQQKQGKFAVEFDGHCISWNAEKNYILETDPSYGQGALEITDQLLVALDIKKLERVFRIVETKVR
jgi:hypothetical protein